MDLMADIFKIDLRGMDEITQNINAVRRGVPEWAAMANERTAEEITQLARRNCREIDAYASGDLYKSIESRHSPGGLVFAVGTTEPYGPYIEFGTRPHFPPLDAIRRWCVIKGIPVTAAYPIAAKIAERGTPARPFLYPAFLQGMKQHVNRMQSEYQRGLRRELA